ncbi:hypothetical protein BHE74_00024616, partial [Ensete ventricosum]
IESPDFQVEQVPLPLLFMRTVIQAIDAFPSLVPVDFVMGILSKLVTKQLNVILMPAYCLQLPPPYLENALSRHSNLRIPLASYANQSSMRTSLPRYLL